MQLNRNVTLTYVQLSGHVDRAVKKPMEMHRFYLAYTFETDDRVPQRKIRVMLCSESLLNSILKVCIYPSIPPIIAFAQHQILL